ncbi:hypothetical protein [Acidovorax sp. SUPP2825]|uniref:hypothetical protein n=1 Tax=Acidovorax sp. SUPP2825 TaxID=2920879 RepID=UPI0023DE2409|nr:hypothetical protein [Acidovorax sp. SUPP2825]GKS93201.1 hypothetical protein AVAK2825_01720 [Acidovorax sp. SUPP2825]
MAVKTKNSATLGHPVEPSRWAQIKQAERVGYGAALPIRTNWQDAETYTCPEMRHRSMHDRHPSLIAGKRVVRGEGL